MHVFHELVDLLLQAANMIRHLLELIRVLEALGATIGRVDALQVEVVAALARRRAIATYFPSLTLCAMGALGLDAHLDQLDGGK